MCWDHCWPILRPSWCHLGPSWGHRWPPCGLFGQTWGHLGAILGPPWALLGSWLASWSRHGWLLGAVCGPLWNSTDIKTKPVKTFEKIDVFVNVCWACLPIHQAFEGSSWLSWVVLGMLLEIILGPFYFGALNQCRARAWANRRVPWARPGREPESSLGGGEPPSPDPSPRDSLQPEAVGLPPTHRPRGRRMSHVVHQD